MGQQVPANEFRLRKLGLAQGLESLHMPGLQSLAIGPDGKLWCGTERGLYVFNGRTFRPYRPIDPTGTPLTQILITALITDAEGSLWAGTYERGLYRIRPNGTVQHFTELADSTGLGDDRILCLGLCQRGILVGLHERGVQLFDPSTQKFSLYVPQPQFVRADDLRHLVNSSQHVAPDVADPNIIWQATGSGLVRLDLRNGQSETFHPDPLGPQNSVFGIRHFIQVDGGDLILATWGKGLFRFDPSTKEFLKIDLSDNDFWVNNIKHIEPLPDGRWLLAQGGAGLSVFDPRTGKLEWIDRQIRPFFMHKDPVGDLWVATLGQGVVAMHQGYQHLRPLPFERVVDLKPFGNGNLILTDGPPMLTITARDHRVVRSISLNPKTELEYPQQVLAGGSDTALVLFHKGLMMVNMATGQVTDLTPNLKGLHNPDRAGLIAMTRSADGELWIGSTWNGIIRLDRKMRPVRSYGGEKGNSTGNDLTYIGWVTDMATDANGNAWYATLRGHGYFDRGKQKFINFPFVPGNDGTLGFKRINALCPTTDSMLVASAEAGLAIRGLQAGGSLMGLRDAEWAKAGVSDVAVGADGSLWAITPKGLIIRRENEKPLRFGPAYGLRGNEKLMVDANGQVLILHGGKLLTPRHPGPATGLSMPDPRIVGLKVNGLERPTSQGHIELQPDENALELRIHRVAVVERPEILYAGCGEGEHIAVEAVGGRDDRPCTVGKHLYLNVELLLIPRPAHGHHAGVGRGYRPPSSRPAPPKEKPRWWAGFSIGLSYSMCGQGCPPITGTRERPYAPEKQPRSGGERPYAPAGRGRGHLGAGARVYQSISTQTITVAITNSRPTTKLAIAKPKPFLDSGLL